VEQAIEERVTAALSPRSLPVPGGPRKRTSSRCAMKRDDLCRQRFSADPHFVGRALSLDGQALKVVGVMLPGFAYPTDAQLWTPWCRRLPRSSRTAGCGFMSLRLRSGASCEPWVEKSAKAIPEASRELCCPHRQGSGHRG
jgi:hypothetical protein